MNADHNGMERSKESTNRDPTSQFQNPTYYVNSTSQFDMLSSRGFHYQQSTNNLNMSLPSTHQTRAGNIRSTYRFQNIGPHPLSLKKMETRSIVTTLQPRTTPSSSKITIKAIILAFLEQNEKQPVITVESFLDQLHPSLCSTVCNCKNHSDLLHHYLMCPRTNCVICPRVDELWRSRSKPVSCYDITGEENYQRATKRTKVENAPADRAMVMSEDNTKTVEEVQQVDDWSLYVASFLVEDKIEELKDVFSRPGDSSEVPIDIDLDPVIRETATFIENHGNWEVCGEDPRKNEAAVHSDELLADQRKEATVEGDTQCSNSTGISNLLHENLNVEDKENGYTEPVAISENLVDDEEDDKIELMHEDENGDIEASNDDPQSNSFNMYDDCCSDKENELMPEADEAYQCSGVALTDFLTAEEIRQNLRSLNPSAVDMESPGNTTRPSVGMNTCQLCLKGEIQFAAPPMNCESCGLRILQRTYQWTQDESGKRYSYCNSCSNQKKKSHLAKADHVAADEPWVHCDKCKKWQHQICALYNPLLDKKKVLKYNCPFCRLDDMESHAHEFTHPGFEARDLPSTMLSDHIEQRLHRSLEQERQDRADALGKSPAEVPGAEDLTVRVVVSVDKSLKVKKKYFTFLPEGTYPDEFPYKLKVILLFQKLDGVDVLIFAMYVQEFGTECEEPNRRSIYISYLDSVKYFRPETKTVAGVPLRTFVYHQVLIGYLDYCKQRGFMTCYIWSCSPLKGDDFILYCHPQTQKKPKKSRLVEWYETMIRKAMDENIAEGYTNFYKKFFIQTKGSEDIITAARLPYFEGSYWDIAIESILPEIEKGEAVRKVSKRFIQQMGHYDLSEKTTKDILLMQKLGIRILSDQADLLVITLGSKKHRLNKKQVDTCDQDGSIHCNIVEERCSFLKFCQENNLQFDTLRRAKHSSMMILHHLR